MHISSLPSKEGIGTFGKEAYRFVDFLKKAGQTYWQILPLCPIGAGNSPYHSICCFAGNPLFIDIELLVEDGLLNNNLNFQNIGNVDYDEVKRVKTPLLSVAAKEFLKRNEKEFIEFCSENEFWLNDFALFSVIKDVLNLNDFSEWDSELLNKKKTNEFTLEHLEEIEIVKAIQFLFFKQWFNLKEYANKNGIRFIGDLPIYVSPYSSDVFSYPEGFVVDEKLAPKLLAGVPPDAFAEKGQLWGNPIYNWAEMKKDNYSWWINRIKSALSIYDLVRIDHFRGFDSYYCIKKGEETAENGVWKKGPGASLFKEAEKKLSKLPIIAEDLGIITDSVKKLLKTTGFPGMKVLQFAFDSRENNDYLPHNYERNSIVYTGTHDNDTILGWFNSIPENDKEYAVKYMNLTENEGYNFGMIRTALASVSDVCILTFQDLIAKGSEGRMNIPGTPEGNWVWRTEAACINDWLAGILFELTKLYGR